MKRRVMRQEDVAEFCRYLQGEERSQGTIETYRREIRAFAATRRRIAWLPRRWWWPGKRPWQSGTR